MLSLDQLFVTLWRRKLTFLLAFVLTLGAIAVVTYRQPKVYATTAYILVGTTRAAGSDFEATQTNQVVLKTYAELLQTRNVAIEVARRLPSPTAPSAIERSVSVAPISQSQLIRITAEAGDPIRAQTLANTYAEVFVERADKLSDDTDGAISSTLADRAARDGRPVRPRPKLYLSIGAVLAGLLAAGVAIVRDRFDQRLKIDEQASDLYGIPILARVPEQPTASLRGLSRFDPQTGPDNVLGEAFNLLLTNIVFAGLGTTQAKSIAVVSSGEGEGKSTCCIGLARAAVSLDMDVLLVDGDLRRRRLSAMLGLSDEDGRGFSHVLAQAPQRWSTDDLGTEVVGGLHVLAAGQHDHPTTLLSGSIPAFERWAARAYSVVVFDTPPVSVGADASLIAAATEEVLLVVNVRTARRGSLQQTIDQLTRVQANVIGVVLNRTDPSSGPQAYYSDQPSRRGDRHDEGVPT